MTDATVDTNKAKASTDKDSNHVSGKGPRFGSLRSVMTRQSCLIAIAACAIGVAIPTIAINVMQPRALGSAVIAQDATDKVVAHYEWHDSTVSESADVTAQEVINWASSSTIDDGSNYAVPDASTVTQYVQAKILYKLAEHEGISVSDDDVDAYVKESYGDSYSTVADLVKDTQMDESNVREALRMYLASVQLQNKIAGDDTTEAPASPTVADGDADEKTKDYADYIVSLAQQMGEWDDDANDFVEDSAIANALDGRDFSTDGASYNDALQAFYAAYSEYQPKAQEQASAWTDYENEHFSNVVLTMYSLDV